MMKFPSPSTKIGQVLKALMTGKSYNLFEAATELNERSLHSTVSAIQNNYGITVMRDYEKVIGAGGNLTRCRRYWISSSERMRIKDEIELAKEEALPSSDQTPGKGLDFYISDDSAGGKDKQDSMFMKPVIYVQNCLKALGRF